MDPHTGQVYTEEEVENLPDEIKKRLVRVPKGQVRRYQKRQKSALKRQYGETPAVVKRRAKNKRAKASRKKNRKG